VGNGSYKSGKCYYFLDLGPIFFIYFCARDTSKAGENYSVVGFAAILPQLVAM
jgi:hypothetical protein